MKYLLWIILSCTLLFETTHSQESNVRFSFHSIYIPQFTVQEASANHIKPLGVRLMISDYDRAPFEIGGNAYAHYGETARVSFGISLAYLLAERNNHDFKVGLNLNKIELEDVLVDDVDAIGPRLGMFVLRVLETNLNPTLSGNGWAPVLPLYSYKWDIESSMVKNQSLQMWKKYTIPNLSFL